MATEPSATARRRGWALAFLALCLGVGLAARLGAAAIPNLFPSLTLSGRSVSWWADKPLFPDSLEYIRMANHFAAGDGLITDRAGRIARMPAYPVFIAAVYAVFGESILVLRVADAVLGTVAILLAYVLAKRLFGGGAGLAAAAIMAVYPFFVIQALLVLSETLFVVFLLAGAACLARAYGGGGGYLVWAGLAGLGLALATLTRGSFLYVAPLTAAGWVLAGRFGRPAVLGACAMLAAFALAMMPWVVRNWRASDGHLVVTTLRVGPSLYEGLNPRATGGPMMDRINWDEGTQGMGEWERDRYWRRRAIEWAWENPGPTLALAANKLGRFWSPMPNLDQLRGTAPCALLALSYGLVMAFAIVGILRSWRRADVALILLLPVVYYCLLHMVFVGSVRYREAVMPLLVVVAAHGLEGAWRRWRRGSPAAHGAGAGVQRGRDRGAPAGAGAGGGPGQAGGGGG